MDGRGDRNKRKIHEQPMRAARASLLGEHADEQQQRWRRQRLRRWRQREQKWDKNTRALLSRVFGAFGRRPSAASVRLSLAHLLARPLARLLARRSPRDSYRHDRVVAERVISARADRV